MPNWKKVIVSGSNAVLNHITASGHMSVLDGGLTVNTHTSTELEVVGDISASGGTVTGNNISAANQLEAKYRKLDITSATIGNYDGDVVFFGGEGTGFDQHHIHYYDGTNWVRASEANIASAKGLLAIAIGTAPSAGMLIRGFYTIDTDIGTSGDVLYLTTNGNYSITPTETSGRYSRVVGHLIDGSNPNKIYFNPSSDWIEIET